MRSTDLALLALAAIVACGPRSRPEFEDVEHGSTSIDHPNILLLLVDDIGIERLGAWGLPADQTPETPVIDGLVRAGMRFDRAYAQPTCSPTRFTIQTGRQGRRVGLGNPIRPQDVWAMPSSERSLPEVLSEVGYTSALAGKYHLATEASGEWDHARTEGFAHHRGTLGNIGWRDRTEGVEDGVPTSIAGYPTSVTVDDALRYSSTLPEPWFVWVGFHAAHRPLHVPPRRLNPSGVRRRSSDDDKLDALIESVDIEIGRLLDGIDLSDTIVVFVSDNGSHDDHVPDTWSPPDGKGFASEAGTRVPMSICGPGIPPSTSTDALVHTADLFPTIATLAGVDVAGFSVSTVGHWDSPSGPDPIPEPWLSTWTGAGSPVVLDSASFAPVLSDPTLPSPRRYVFTERFLPLGSAFPLHDLQQRSLRDERYKLRIGGPDLEETLHDLEGRHDDGPALTDRSPAEEAAMNRLREVMDHHVRAFEL